MRFTRRSATLLHLAISLVAIVAVLGGLMAIWYPSPLFRHDAVLPLFLTVGLVGVASGPLLTAIVFKPAKWGLRFDMYVISAVQVLGLVGGLYVLAQSRPVLLVVSEYRAVLVHANELVQQPDADGKVASKPWGRFRVVYAEPPSDPEARTRLLELTMATGLDIEQQPRYHAPFDDAPQSFWSGLPQLATREDDPHPFYRWVPTDETTGRYQALPLITRDAGVDLELILDSSTQQVVGVREVPGA